MACANQGTDAAPIVCASHTAQLPTTAAKASVTENHRFEGWQMAIAVGVVALAAVVAMLVLRRRRVRRQVTDVAVDPERHDVQHREWSGS